MSVWMFMLAAVEAGLAQDSEMSCTFPPVEPGDVPIEVVMEGHPSLYDLPGLYRVEMEVNGTGMRASAQPILATEKRDVVVRAAANEATLFALGFDDTGKAALDVVRAEAGQNPEPRIRRTGHCRNYERYIQTWSTS